MISNFYFISFYIIISTSIIGYGQLFFSINKQFKISSNFGYAGLAGILLFCLYSYFSSFFYKHGSIHNLIIILLGFFYFIYHNYKNFEDNFKNLLILVSLLLIYFIAVCIFKTHDDFSYYHFQYSYYLTQMRSVVGIGNFDLGLRTPSSIFYLNSLFYFPVIKYFMFHMSVFVIFLYASIIIIFKIFKNIFEKEINFLTFYYLLSFIFINIFFYRFSEHGTDRSAQILVFLLIGEIFSFINSKENVPKKLSILFLLVALIISLKAFYILYLIFFSVIFYHLVKTRKFTQSVILIFTNCYFYLFLFLLIMILFVNFVNTGCFLYPISITCLDNYPWAIPKEEVQNLNQWYEQWSKAGASPNFRVDNPKIYIENFNWVGNWISSYFFTKVSDFLIGIILLSLLIMVIFAPYKKLFNDQKRNVLLVILLITLLLFEWFYNHPALRYGGYCLISVLIFIPLSILIEKSLLNFEKIKKRIHILLIISLVVFFGRNVVRLNQEYKKYDYNPFKNIHYRFNDSHFNIQQAIEKLIIDYNNCNVQKKTCLKNKGLNVNKVYNRHVFFRY